MMAMMAVEREERTQALNETLSRISAWAPTAFQCKRLGRMQQPSPACAGRCRLRFKMPLATGCS